MRIALYSPLAPVELSSAPLPCCSSSASFPLSDDADIASDLHRFLVTHRHRVELASRLPGKHLPSRPWRWLRVFWERWSLPRRRSRPDLWLTCHAGPDAPDVLGPAVAGRMGIPYVVFLRPEALAGGIGATTTTAGRMAAASLLAARHVFTHARADRDILMNMDAVDPNEVGAKNFSPPGDGIPRPFAHRVTYIPPGIFPEDFPFDPEARTVLRESWGVSFRVPVMLTVTRLDPGAGAEGVAALIRACRDLASRGRDFRLMIAGDGPERRALEEIATSSPDGAVRFLGHVPRAVMHRVYSASDVFTPAGAGESSDVRCLEAQCCGLPVVAWDAGAIPDVVRRDHTAVLVPAGDEAALADALDALLTDKPCRDLMGERAAGHARERHDLDENYGVLETRLKEIAEEE